MRRLCFLGVFCVLGLAQAAAGDLWPGIEREQRPWTYWWWMGSAVDRTNLTRELERYQKAGLGGVHIIPIYGAKGYEEKFIDYLSPKWMEMLAWTCAEAKRLGLGVDMTTGSGWCFGGPHVTDAEANASVVCKTFQVKAAESFHETFAPGSLQTLVAVAPDGRTQDLSDNLTAGGAIQWSAPAGEHPVLNSQPSSLNSGWTVYAISQKPSGQKVKRAGPGGQGWMLNLFYPEAMRDYLKWFDDAFANYSGPRPRAMYHDSYEYRSDWAPDLFAAFEKRRGYRLQDELPALFGKADPERSARVKCDYRETLSDIMAEETLPMWAEWSRKHGFLTRNEAHGSPGNWLDLYAAADIPETEMFYKDRNKLVSKFASSAAHVAGKPLVSSETGTWLKEHFTETLGDMKYLLDDLFLSGVNHVLYHGTCYSPDEAGWPGWHFYASYEMNPRNSIWRDVGALNAYAARCQSVLQAGKPDNDILVYWPIYDVWHNPSGLARNLTIHARDWFEDQPIGQTAEQLWKAGYAFDYISDRQLRSAKASQGNVEVPGGNYRVVLVPKTQHMPLSTFRQLLALAKEGATILFQDDLPADVPGWADLEKRRAESKGLAAQLKFTEPPSGAAAGRSRASKVREAVVGRGRVLVGDLSEGLQRAAVAREALFDQPGLMCIRRVIEGGHYYFIANRSEQKAFTGWVALARSCKSAAISDPLSAAFGIAMTRAGSSGAGEVYLSLEPGASLILRCFDRKQISGSRWFYADRCGAPTELKGIWTGKFVDGGPEMPSPFAMSQLASWTSLLDTNAQRFAGTARYRLEFDAPPEVRQSCWLDLGRVCQSARVRLNGKDLGTLITPPFRVRVDALKPAGNVLEVDVTNVSANRIRDLDRRGVKWKNFYDINFVNLDYKPFDASKWPLTDSGLLGPVTVRPIQSNDPL